jgi:hypothetical protein
VLSAQYRTEKLWNERMCVEKMTGVERKNKNLKEKMSTC